MRGSKCTIADASATSDCVTAMGMGRRVEAPRMAIRVLVKTPSEAEDSVEALRSLPTEECVAVARAPLPPLRRLPAAEDREDDE